MTIWQARTICWISIALALVTVGLIVAAITLTRAWTGWCTIAAISASLTTIFATTVLRRTRSRSTP